VSFVQAGSRLVWPAKSVAPKRRSREGGPTLGW
jgi:hypothetical protein